MQAKLTDLDATYPGNQWVRGSTVPDASGGQYFTPPTLAALQRLRLIMYF